MPAARSCQRLLAAWAAAARGCLLVRSGAPGRARRLSERGPRHCGDGRGERRASAGAVRVRVRLHGRHELRVGEAPCAAQYPVLVGQAQPCHPRCGRQRGGGDRPVPQRPLSQCGAVSTLWGRARDSGAVRGPAGPPRRDTEQGRKNQQRMPILRVLQQESWRLGFVGWTPASVPRRDWRRFEQRATANAARSDERVLHRGCRLCSQAASRQ